MYSRASLALRISILAALTLAPAPLLAEPTKDPIALPITPVIDGRVQAHPVEDPVLQSTHDDPAKTASTATSSPSETSIAPTASSEIQVTPRSTAITSQPMPQAPEQTAPILSSSLSATYRSGSDGSGCFGTSTSPIAGKVVKTLGFPEVLQGSPIACDDLIYLTGSQSVYALDPAANKLVWTFKTSGSPTVPAIMGKALYVATDLGGLYALNVKTGSQLWRQVEPRRVYKAPLLAAAGRIYAGDLEGTLHCFSAASGQPLWAYRTSRWLSAAPVLADGLLFLGGQNTRFVALDPASGTVKWRGGAGAAIDQMPTWQAGNVYFAGDDGVIHATRVKGVIPLWKSGAFGSLSSPFILRGTRGLSATTSGQIFSLDLASRGRSGWKVQLPGPVQTALVVSPSSDQVFALTGNGQLFALNGATGEELWHHDFNGLGAADPILWDGSLWVPHGKQLSEVQ